MSADAVETVVGFASTLRAAGVAASPDRVHAFVTALDVLNPTIRADVYWAGRLTLCANADDLGRYERAFAAYFAGEAPHRKVRRRPLPVPVARDTRGVRAAPDGTPAEDDPDGPRLSSAASVTEVLRARDFATLSAPERAELDRLLAALRLPGELRRTRRHAPSHRGPIDRNATVRELLRGGGEPARLRRARPRRRPRRVVVLLDVSGSMSPYAGALLRFAHATAHRATAGPAPEIFTVGTRLTRVTREMSHRDPDAAMAAVSATVPDFSGGTRLGELLKHFLDRWGQRGMARGAVVVILSDGWERGDATLLGEQMARLARLAHRVVWANPRKARPGYAPLAAGMAAALPHVDDFVEGHSLAALERLAAVVGGASTAGRRRAVRDILNDLQRWEAAGTPVGLATVVGVYRSAPRQPGASMAVTAEGTVLGSVSGGCVEGAVFEVATEVLATGTPRLVRYGISDDDAFAVGLTCGGTIDVFVERLDPASPAPVREVAQAVADSRPIAVATVIEAPDGAPVRAGARLTVTPTGVTGGLGTEGLDAAVTDDVRGFLEQGVTAQRRYGVRGERRVEDVTVFVESLAPHPRMIVFGAIDFAAAVARIGAFLGYHVTVCDARAVFATERRFPQAHEVVVEWPHRYLARTRVDERTVLAVLTHDPKFDVPLLEVALRTPAGYIGAMGSRRTHADRMARLREKGLTEAELARLRSPIGLDLGARTPEETAVSIAAEIVALRWSGSGRPLTSTGGAIHAPDTALASR